MLPRLLLVVGLSAGVMLPLIWAAFAPVPEFRQASEPAADPVHSGPAGISWRGVPEPEGAKPLISSAQSDETTIGTAPDGDGEASAARPGDLPPARPLDPALAAPGVPRAYREEAAPEPPLSREPEPLPGEAAIPTGKAEPLPEVNERGPAPGAGHPQAYDKEAASEPPVAEEAKPLPETATTPTAKLETLPEVKERGSAPGASLPQAYDKEAAPPSEAATPTAKVETLPEVKERGSAPGASLPQAHDKEAAPEPQVSDKAKPLPGETATPTVKLETLPEVGGRRSAPGANLPQAYDKEAAPEPPVSDKAKPLPDEAAAPTVKVETLPEVKQQRAAPGAENNRPRAHANGIRSRQKSDRKKPRDRSGWTDVMRDAGWLEPRRYR
jgi:hypothetical protein